MKKRAIFSLAMASLLGVATALSGCGGNDANTIKFYAYGETPAELIAYKAMVDDFNATVGKEKGIKVAYSPKTAGNEYESLIIRTGMSQNGPDIYMVPEKEFKAWTRYGLFSPLDDLVKGGSLNLDTIWKSSIERYHYNPTTNTSTASDPLYSLPIDSSPTALFYNKTAMETAGVIVIGVEAKDMEAWNNNEIADKYGKKKSDYPTLQNVTVPKKGYFRSVNNYYSASGKPETWYSPYNNDGSLNCVLVFNDEIAMNWDETEDLACLLTKAKNSSSTTTYGYYTEWWFNYGWSVGGDCVADTTGNGDYIYTLPDYTPNYTVLEGTYTGEYTGKTYQVGESLETLDKLAIAKGQTLTPAEDGGYKVNGTQIGSETDPESAIRASVKTAVEDGTLGKLPSTKTAITRFASLAGASGLNVAPYPNDLQNVTSFSQFTVGNIAMLIETAANIPTAKKEAQFTWGVAPLPQYRQYANPTDGADDTLVVEGRESGHAESTSVSIRANSSKKEQAYTFMEYLVGEKGQMVKLQQGLVPNLKSLVDTDEYKQTGNFTYMNVFLNAMNNQAAGDWWYMPDTQWISIWADRLNGDVRNGTMSLDSWFTSYISATNEQLKEYK